MSLLKASYLSLIWILMDPRPTYHFSISCNIEVEVVASNFMSCSCSGRFCCLVPYVVFLQGGDPSRGRNYTFEVIIQLSQHNGAIL